MRTPCRLVLPFALVAVTLGSLPCQERLEPVPKDYWYRGAAEISRFDLVQHRYGEPRQGHAVLIFVTEDFRTDLQVKAETGQGPAVNVLKLNAIRRFVTGVYDYSLMTSVFTPARDAAPGSTLKVTASVQDWCGHSWLQLNRKPDGYAVTGHSYFEAEAEQSGRLPAMLLEDEIWTLLRLGPGKLPVGEVQVVPGACEARLQHRAPAAEPATAARAAAEPVAGVPHDRYEIRYACGRTLAITYERAFPHRIAGWREHRGSGERAEAGTRAERTHLVTTPYWQHNHRGSEGMRAQLGLPAR